MLIDTHAHLNFAAFNEDRNKVIKKCLDNDLWIINVGTNFETSKKAIDITESYSQGVYAAIGLHPINLDTGLVKIKLDKNEMAIDAYGKDLDKVFEKQFDFEKYKKLALNSKKVVAIGEIGLDYWHKPKTKSKLAEFKQKQKDLLLQEIKLAQELALPIIFHCRMAHDDLYEVLNYKLQITNYKQNTNYNNQNSKLQGVIHCFTGNWKQAQKYLDMGFYLGFNGIIFKLNLDEIIKKTPFDRILIETDCPFLTPPLPTKALAKAGRNEPIFIKYIAQKIAGIKNVSFEKIAEITTKNAQKLFRIFDK